MMRCYSVYSITQQDAEYLKAASTLNSCLKFKIQVSD